MTPGEIAQAEKICAEATPAPWWHKEEARPTFDYPVTYRVVHLLRPLGENCVSDELVMRSKSDAAFVAGARTLLPKALAEIKRLTKERDAALQRQTTELFAQNEMLKAQLADAKAALQQANAEAMCLLADPLPETAVLGVTEIEAITSVALAKLETAQPAKGIKCAECSCDMNAGHSYLCSQEPKAYQPILPAKDDAK